MNIFLELSNAYISKRYNNFVPLLRKRERTTIMNNQGHETLGGVLKKARESKTLTLRNVEDLTGISNAYLSQLENDKVKKPAADTLYKLAGIYKVDFNYLLQTAGLVEKKMNANVTIGRFIFSKDNLTKEEEEELINYLQYIRQKKKK